MAATVRHIVTVGTLITRVTGQVTSPVLGTDKAGTVTSALQTTTHRPVMCSVKLPLIPRVMTSQETWSAGRTEQELSVVVVWHISTELTVTCIVEKTPQVTRVTRTGLNSVCRAGMAHNVTCSVRTISITAIIVVQKERRCVWGTTAERSVTRVNLITMEIPVTSRVTVLLTGHNVQTMALLFVWIKSLARSVRSVSSGIMNMGVTTVWCVYLMVILTR